MPIRGLSIETCGEGVVVSQHCSGTWEGSLDIPLVEGEHIPGESIEVTEPSQHRAMRYTRSIWRAEVVFVFLRPHGLLGDDYVESGEIRSVEQIFFSRRRLVRYSDYGTKLTGTEASVRLGEGEVKAGLRNSLRASSLQASKGMTPACERTGPSHRRSARRRTKRAERRPARQVGACDACP